MQYLALGHSLVSITSYGRFVPLVSNISGVQPYKIAHITCIDVSKLGWMNKGEKHTVELRLNPIELSVAAHLDVTLANMIQLNAVMNVLPTNDHFRPSLDPVIYAPTYPRPKLIHRYKGRKPENKQKSQDILPM